MEISVIIMGSMFTLAIFGPFVYLIRMGKNRVKALQRQLKSEATANNLSISTIDLFTDRAIGLDTNAKRLLYVKEFGKNFYTMHIELENASSCELEITEDVIRLLVNTVNERPVITSIVFFDRSSDDPFDRGHMLQAAIKWEKIISAVIETHFLSPLKAA